MNETAVLEQRRQARAAKHLVDNALFDLHLKAADALHDPASCSDVRERALRQVAKWEHDHLCNPRYVETWRSILGMPAETMRVAMLRNDAEGIALRQNSPFGFLLDATTQ